MSSFRQRDRNAMPKSLEDRIQDWREGQMVKKKKSGYSTQELAERKRLRERDFKLKAQSRAAFMKSQRTAAGIPDYNPKDKTTWNFQARTKENLKSDDPNRWAYQLTDAGKKRQDFAPTFNRQRMLNTWITSEPDSAPKTLSAESRRVLALFGSKKALPELIQFHAELFPHRKTIKHDEVVAFLAKEATEEYLKNPDPSFRNMRATYPTPSSLPSVGPNEKAFTAVQNFNKNVAMIRDQNQGKYEASDFYKKTLPLLNYDRGYSLRTDKNKYLSLADRKAQFEGTEGYMLDERGNIIFQ